MPDVPRPETAATWLAGLNARIGRLESYGQIGMAGVTSASWTETNPGYYANTTTWTDLSESYSAVITLYRPLWYLALGQAVYSNDVNSGHGVVTWLRLIFTTAANAGPAASFYGEATGSAPMGHSEGGPVANGLVAACYALAPGSYFAAFQYRMSASGAGYPQMRMAGSLSSSIALFRLSG